MADAIAAAIDATEQRSEARFGGQIALSTGRVIAINVPADLSDAEFLEATVILIAQVRTAARQRPAGRIILPDGMRAG